MKERILTILVFILMMVQPTVEENTMRHASDSVVNNILFEHTAMISTVIIMLIATIMI